jgi:hypothetical protein
MVFSYENTSTGPIQIPSDVPTDCVTLYKIYEHFKLGRPGYIVGDVMFNCCYYEVRRLHSMDVFATNEWECENDSQAPDNHITSVMLNNKGLAGEIPWNIIKGFSKLQTLSLNNNKLTGDATNISHLSNISTLQNVDLSSNMLSGTLPTSLPTNLSVINLQSNEVSGPLPESWTQKQNFKCTVPSGICKPKSLTDVTSICNNNLPECKEDQVVTKTSTKNNDESIKSNEADANANKDDQSKNVNSDALNSDKSNEKDSSKVVNTLEEDDLLKSDENESSHAALYTLLSIIIGIVVLIGLIVGYVKYKNAKHDKEMITSLKRRRETLQKIQKRNSRFSFSKSSDAQSVNEFDNAAESRYSASIQSGSPYIASNLGANQSINSGKNKSLSDGNNSDRNSMDQRAKEHVINMNSDAMNDSNRNSKTFEIERSQTEPSLSYSYSTNKYNTTLTSLYDSSYCSTCDSSYSSISSASSLSNDQSSFSEEGDSNSQLLSFNRTNSLNNNKANRPRKDSEATNFTLGSSIGGFDSSRNNITKRSIISSSSNNTLVNPTGYGNNFSSTNNVFSSSATTTKLLEEDNFDNLKIVLEDIKEEENSLNSPSLNLSVSEDLGKGLNMSYILKDNSFFNENNHHEDQILLNL